MTLLSSLILLCMIAATLAYDQALEKYIAKKRSKINARWRPHYHIAPPVGWMNDPNGFSYYKGKYHLFYQFNPYKTAWGSMHWGHSTSSNLVDWETLPTALLPEQEQCYSGCAVVNGDNLVLMYTGHVNFDQAPYFTETQYLATSNDGVNFTKYSGNPVLRGPSNTPDFRDPKAWKYGDYWYVVIGSSYNNKGRMLLYRSLNLIRWQFLRVLAEADDDLGYMWECPDYIKLDKDIIMMCPSGMYADGDSFRNFYQDGYIIGNLNYSNNVFTQETKFQEIDHGHDFYATYTLEKDGNVYLVAWFSMWGNDYPEAADGWVGMMTLIRQLSLNGGRILQKPVADITNLRDIKVIDGQLDVNQVIQFGQTAEIIINGDLAQKIVLSITGHNGGGGQAVLSWDPDARTVRVDRGDGDPRQAVWDIVESRSWRLFLDACSLELFCGEGELVFSSRVYPNGDWDLTNQSPQPLSVEAYTLKQSVPL